MFVKPLKVVGDGHARPRINHFALINRIYSDSTCEPWHIQSRILQVLHEIPFKGALLLELTLFGVDNRYSDYTFGDQSSYTACSDLLSPVLAVSNIFEK